MHTLGVPVDLNSLACFVLLQLSSPAIRLVYRTRYQWGAHTSRYTPLNPLAHPPASRFPSPTSSPLPTDSPRNSPQPKPQDTQPPQATDPALLLLPTLPHRVRVGMEEERQVNLVRLLPCLVILKLAMELMKGRKQHTANTLNRLRTALLLRPSPRVALRKDKDKDRDRDCLTLVHRLRRVDLDTDRDREGTEEGTEERLGDMDSRLWVSKVRSRFPRLFLSFRLPKERD